MKTLWARRRYRLTFPLALLFACGLVTTGEIAYHRSSEEHDQLASVLEARRHLQNALRQIIDAETGQRGYLLTGDKKYLEPYSQARANLDDSLAALATYYAGQDLVRQQAFANLRTLLENKMAELNMILGMFNKGDSAWRAAMGTDIGLSQMTAIRDRAKEVLDYESARVAHIQQVVRETLMLGRIGSSSLVVICMLFFTLYLRQSSRLIQERLNQQLALERNVELLEQQVSERTAQLTELANHLQRVREEERSLLARELHDELGALLTAAKLDVARLKQHLATTAASVPIGHSEADNRLQHLSEALNNCIALKRRIIEDLHPSSLNKLGLPTALDILVREFSERSGISADCLVDEVELDDEAELTIYRLVQEALTNILKYAEASHVEVLLQRGERGIEVMVKDNGKGFNPTATGSHCHGLLGMRFRVQAVAGAMRVASSPGQGTIIEARVPLTRLLPGS